jgi:hypothetical protein
MAYLQMYVVEDLMPACKRRAVGFELLEAIMGVRMRRHGQICHGGPWWPAAMWMRLAIKPIAMRRGKNQI